MLPAAVLLLTASAVAGCTTVSPARPDATTPPGRSPAVVTLTPSPGAPLLADVRPDPGTPSAAAPGEGPASAVPRASQPVRHKSAAGAGIRSAKQLDELCAMGRAYGRWAAGSSAATICQGVYGR
ncbi:hypothetical protein [Streptomyces sp. NRRL F-5123]|uniref:hypothetical protein n=1 Tax=Streptomyces sp. NRRL F-5123 TaxID=1463856 RepID=UPI0004E1F95B|nr:hypothetical protein [Streptomyces sp. NRRL F-5123]